MTNIVKGQTAFDQLEEGSKPQGDKAIRYMKSGNTILVGVDSVNEFVMTKTHAVYPSIMTTQAVDGSYYEKAVQLLWEDYNEVKDNETARKEVLQKINWLKAKPTFYFGFTDIEEGKQIIISVSENQAKTIHTGLKKLEKQLKNFPLEITKGDKGAWTILPYMDDLTAEQEANFKATAPLDMEIYKSVMYTSDEARQLADLKAFGFDLSRLGITEAPTQAEEKVAVGEEDLPF